MLQKSVVFKPTVISYVPMHPQATAEDSLLMYEFSTSSNYHYRYYVYASGFVLFFQDLTTT